MRVSRPLASSGALGALLLAALLPLPGCGSSGVAVPAEPFEADFPSDPPSQSGPLPPATPPPAPPRTPVWDPDAVRHARSLLFGSFPSDVVRFGDTVFVSDADQIDADGARIVPVDVSGPVPGLSTEFAPVTVHASSLVDSAGNPGDVANPVGFGFFLNDLLVVDDRVGFALANAGGSDSTPALSNLVVFDPTTGAVTQVVDLANPVSGAGLLDSTGAPVPPVFRQAGAEGLEMVPVGPGRGRLHVAMTNLVFGAPSFGTTKYPGTVQVFDVNLGAAAPVSPRTGGPFATETIVLGEYNPVALHAIVPDAGAWGTPNPRVLLTVAGATGFDPQGNLVPTTDASVHAYDGTDATFLGSFRLGRGGLSGVRPAVGRDGAGHRVGYFPSSTTGEVYLLRLDGLHTPEVDASLLAVLRGPNNGIPIATADAGSPGGNVAGIGLSPDGRTLVVAGFGNLFAFPQPTPGRLFLLNLPVDVVASPAFAATFVPGATEYAVTPGRALGALVLVPNPGGRPDVYVNVSGPIDPSSFLGTGPASLGTLQTFGLVR
jgi:hypothetical protein